MSGRGGGPESLGLALPYMNREYQAVWEQMGPLSCAGCRRLLEDRRGLYELNGRLVADLNETREMLTAALDALDAAHVHV